MGLSARFVRLTTGLFFVLAVISFTLKAETVKLNASSNENRITENSGQGFVVSFSFSEFSAIDIKTPKGIFSRIIVPSYSRTGQYGYPELPVKSELIEIPVHAEVQVRIVNAEVKEYSLDDLGILYPILPNQPPVPKTGVVPEFIYDKNAYKTDAYTQSEPATVEFLGNMRGVNIGRLDIKPVRYNPVTKMIRVYEKLEVEVTFINADLPATEFNKQVYGDRYFSPVFRSLFNYRAPENAGRENFSQYPVTYVIVSDPMFEEQLQPLVEWKTMKGFTVVEAYTDDPNVGSTTSQIKEYLQNLYDNGTPEHPAPTFVLFVGDIAQVPTWTGQAAGHVTDLYYCEFTGDYFPEIFYGRYSAQNADQLQPQIDKTLMYEQYTMPVPTYLDSVVMIAGMDGTYGPVHGNGQINYGTENYFNVSNGLYSYTYLYPESGNSAAQIIQNISDGVTYANYTAHGSPDGWADPGFTLGDIPTLQNEGKYGLLVGNCCSTSEYQVGECFGEAIVRAENKGAVGYIGASNSTYWDEDYYFGVGVGAITADPPSYEETSLGAYDRMFHTHGEPFGEWYTTMDQMVFAGNLAVTEGSPGSAEYYWEAYCLMGDPSLMVYFSEPPVMTVTHDPLLPLGSGTFTVNAVPYAYIAVTMDGEWLGAALADSTGMAEVNILPVPSPGYADIVVTAQNYQPYTGNVLIASPEGPYVMLNELIINDMNGNNNGMIEFSEDVLFHAELRNWGNGDAINTHATLVAEDDYITVTDDFQEYGTVSAQDSVMQMDAFRFTVADLIPDQHIVSFSLNIEGETREVWSSSFTVTLFAPAMEIGSLAIVD
ncbi:MAG: C25 family cysteine peptidase, partial [Bacteroidales bacterium]|nr:C25 family cysteine peptidase [Bacteroidales bacterium]